MSHLPCEPASFQAPCRGYKHMASSLRDGDSLPNETLRRQLEFAVGEYVPGPAFARSPHVNGKKRFTEVLHNFCNEPLPWYKKLEHSRPEWPREMRRFTAKDGFRVADTHNITVSARDQRQRTYKGTLRTSSGMVTYSAIHAGHFELDAEDLVKILREQEPYSQQGKMWSVKRLEKAYQSRFRAHGSWARHGVPFKVYLSLFPKTFDLFGSSHDFVRVASKSRLHAVDNPQDAMISLALGCEKGYVERTAPLEGTMRAGQESVLLPELSRVRAKTLFRSTSDPGLRSHTLPTIKAEKSALDASFMFPQSKADTLPPYMPFKGLESPEGGGSVASTMRVSDMHDTRSTFRVSFQLEHEGSRSATPAEDF